MNESSQAKIQRAQQLYRSGAHDEARRLIASVIKAEPNNVDAWLSAALMASASEQRLKLAQKALEMDPFNERAEALVARLRGDAQEARAASPMPAPEQGRPPARSVPASDGAPRPRQNPLPLYIGIGLAMVVLIGLIAFAALNLSRGAGRTPAATSPPPAQGIVVSPPAPPSPTLPAEAVTSALTPTPTPTPAAYDLTGTAFRAIDETEQAALRAEATSAAQTAAPGG